MATVLVTDGEQRAALATVRSLGRAGHKVLVASKRRWSLAGASRFAGARAQVPDPLADPARYAQRIVELTGTWAVDLVVPLTEATILALAPAAGRLTAHLVGTVDDRFRRICDKAAVLVEAAALGIGVPVQVRVERPDEGRSLPESVRYPVVVKSTHSVNEELTGGGRAKGGLQYAGDRPGLIRALNSTPTHEYPLLVQERIVGPGVGIFLLLGKGGEVVARFAHRRLREKPPSGGVSVLRESIAVPEDLYQRSLALLRRFEWEGVAMVEYKMDLATGTPYLMEINGRLWGSLQLGIDAGVDFPALFVELALGHSPVPVTTYRIGVRSQWFWGDVDHLLARLRRSAEELALPPGAPSRWRALAGFAEAMGPGAREEVFRWSDPVPFVRETLDWFHRQ